MVPKDINVIGRPELEINVEGKQISVYLEVTNLVVYPDLRDLGGSPCAVISWIQFQTVK
ncbi:hypothetical protein [Sulfuracidifex tepidarius]|uniref:hypothetical protein n=1 Tax=Sulfuracidifex tepidarius TaxID=1294262 RepID=UPI000AB4C040|nr:hypothetical protein [Sulfuracidifex tepidarius]